MEDILNIFGGAQMRNIVILIGVDVILGIIAALKSKEFVIGKLAGFMKRGILTYVFGFAVIIMIGEALPSLSLVVAVAYWVVVLALIGSILANLGKLGLPIPKMLK